MTQAEDHDIIIAGAGLALARPRAWRFLTGSLMAAAGKRLGRRLRPTLAGALPVGQG